MPEVVLVETVSFAFVVVELAEGVRWAAEWHFQEAEQMGLLGWFGEVIEWEGVRFAFVVAELAEGVVQDQKPF